MNFSPLFQMAAKELADAARREFAASGLGRALGEVEQAVRGGGGWRANRPQAPDRVGRALLRYRHGGARMLLNELRGVGFGEFAREIERYAKGGGESADLAREILDLLGPAGQVIRTLVGIGGGGGSDIDRLLRLIQAFGWEGLPGPGQGTASQRQRAVEAAYELLKRERPELLGQGPAPAPRGPGKYPQTGRVGQGPQGDYVELPMRHGGDRRFPPDHPIVTGDMVPAPGSSNVHSFGYDVDAAYLYVRFLGYRRGERGPDGRAARGGPGSLYRYASVTPEEFLTLLAAGSAGEWVWDHLRVRGTWSGHQKDYELVGIEGGYVPRKATVRRNFATGELEEWLVKRTIYTQEGNWLESQYEEERVGMPPWGMPDRGRPDGPDRGTPDRGRL